MRAAALVGLVFPFLAPAAPAFGEPGGQPACHSTVSLAWAASACRHEDEGTTPIADSPAPAPVATEPTCISVGATCVIPGCVDNVHHLVGQSLTTTYSDGSSRRYCQYDRPVGPTPGQVAQAMRRLLWPASVLRIQPVKGRTLVNLRTNFYTTNTGPTTRTVTLLGRRITIEATPSYRWTWGDGGQASGTSPGAAYPNLLVTHVYLRKGVVHPRLDTVYAGRYRIGNGAWRAIPGMLTVAGTPHRLEVTTARPVLVNPYE